MIREHLCIFVAHTRNTNSDSKKDHPPLDSVGLGVSITQSSHPRHELSPRIIMLVLLFVTMPVGLMHIFHARFVLCCKLILLSPMAISETLMFYRSPCLWSYSASDILLQGLPVQTW